MIALLKRITGWGYDPTEPRIQARRESSRRMVTELRTEQRRMEGVESTMRERERSWFEGTLYPDFQINIHHPEETEDPEA